MGSDNVINFRKPKPPSTGGNHVFTVHIYEDDETDTVTTHVEQPDRPDGTVDMTRFLDALYRTAWFVEMDNRKADPNAEDLLLVTRIYRSSLCSTRWGDPDKMDDNGFHTPAQLRWLKRRLADIYWQVDIRRGVAYRVHQALNDLGRLIARLRGRVNAEKTGR
jgi:hypothetical protein